MHGYDPYMDRPAYSRYTERAVFDYSDQQGGTRYSDRPSYDSPSESGSRPGFTPQVVDYNHGSLSAGSSEEKERERPEPIGSGTDVDQREMETSRAELQQSLYRSPEDSARRVATADADVDINFIQDIIVSVFGLISPLLLLFLNMFY